MQSTPLESPRQLPFWSGPLAGRVVSQHKRRTDADDDREARNRNLDADTDYTYVVEEVE